MSASKALRSSKVMGLGESPHRHFSEAAARAERRQVAALRHSPLATPHCSYHVGHELVAVTQTRRLMWSTSPTSKTRQRTILNCPVPLCPYVAALPGEKSEMEDAA